MSAIEQDMADLARRHYFWWPNHSSIGMEAHCQCGERPRDWSHWADHFAQVLKAELGISQEWGLRPYNGISVLWKSEDRDESRCRESEFPDFELVERDVMPWQPDRHRNRTS